MHAVHRNESCKGEAEWVVVGKKYSAVFHNYLEYLHLE